MIAVGTNAFFFLDFQRFLINIHKERKHENTDVLVTTDKYEVIQHKCPLQPTTYHNDVSASLIIQNTNCKMLYRLNDNENRIL